MTHPARVHPESASTGLHGATSSSVLHDLPQQLSYLRAALEQEKKPLGFLVGAGAPMSIHSNDGPLVPGLEELTERVTSDVDPTYSTAVETLLGHLPKEDTANLEALLNYVRALAALPGSDAVRGIEVDVLSGLDAEICNVIRTHVDVTLPQGDTPYSALALWIGSVQRAVPTQIFTTNYDLLIEQALERQRVAYFDGFMGSCEPVFDLQAIEEDQLPSRWALLWKLHGSINWSQSSNGTIIRRPGPATDDTSALIYPSHLKYEQSRRLPYLAMMDRLKAFLRRPGAILITSGFSFRDQHINEVLDQSLRVNPTASVHGLLFGSIDQYADAVTLANGLPNLLLLAEDSAVVGSLLGRWAPQVHVDSQNEVSTTCDLGDFSQLGDLLRTLTGALPLNDTSNE